MKHSTVRFIYPNWQEGAPERVVRIQYVAFIQNIDFGAKPLWLLYGQDLLAFHTRKAFALNKIRSWNIVEKGDDLELLSIIERLLPSPAMKV